MKRRGESGTALVEFALLAPIVLLLIVGLIEVGRYGYYAILAANAARAGAQYGAQTLQTANDPPGMQYAAVQDGQNVFSTMTVNATSLCSISGGAPSKCGSMIVPANTTYYVQVLVTAQFNSMLNYPGIPSSVTVNGSSTLRVAQQ